MERRACRLAVLVVMLQLCRLCVGQVIQQPELDLCSSFSPCDECINAHPDCVWCPYRPDDSSELNRCRNRTADQSDCNTLILQDPEPFIGIIEDEDFAEAIQVRPQRVEVAVRRGAPSTFQVTIDPAEDYPVDLYILMDLSSSLANTLDQIKNVSNELSETLQRISNQSQIGFGAFVDKTTLPFTLNNLARSNQLPDSPIFCITNRDHCEVPYSFRHILSLTPNNTIFQEGISNVQVSSSIDNAEGGLDALLQASVCGNEEGLNKRSLRYQVVGWRDNTLHLVLFITDDEYHIAGDGKLGGVLRPNDGQCHMERVQDEFEHVLSDFYDYPSVYQLRNILRDNDIIPIFTVTAVRTATYQNLAGILGGVVEELAEDSSNILEVIEDSYNNVRQLIQLEAPPIPGVSFEAVPVEGCDDITPEGACDSVAFNDTVVFNVTITMDTCLTEPREFLIRVPGLGGSGTAVKLIPLCDCPCEEDETVEDNSASCNNNGSLACGVCICNDGRFGELCQCDVVVEETCPTIRAGVECSGNGMCDDCNQCVCSRQENRPGRPFYFGDACECGDDSCFRNLMSDELCSGVRGNCNCTTGDCTCELAPLSNMPYFGSACECNPDPCFNPDHPEVLCYIDEGVDAGECVCGSCRCPENFNAANGSCQPLRDRCGEERNCAMCLKGDRSGSECDDCNEMNELVENRDEAEDIVNNAVLLTCDYTDGSDCENVYYVVLDDDTQPVLVEEDQDCPMLEIWAIALIIVGAIILLGLLILIIAKLILIVLDRRDYKKFTKSLQEAEWAPHENPLYLNPQQDYKNVAYRKRSINNN